MLSLLDITKESTDDAEWFMLISSIVLDQIAYLEAQEDTDLQENSFFRI